MVLISYCAKSETSVILQRGTFQELFFDLNRRQEKLEKASCFMVQEERINGETENHMVVIRTFATEEQGRVFDLIICGGIAENVKLVN